MLTTVPSMKARAEPSTVARSTQRPADSSYRTSRAATGPVGVDIDIGPTATGRGRTRPECDQRSWLRLSFSSHVVRQCSCTIGPDCHWYRPTGTNAILLVVTCGNSSGSVVGPVGWHAWARFDGRHDRRAA